MALTIRTNNHDRQFIYKYDVPAEVLADQFAYLDEDVTDGFFNYHNTWYHTSQFMRIPTGDGPLYLAGWEGAHGDSFFSGVLIKLSDDGETYRIATYTE